VFGLQLHGMSVNIFSQIAVIMLIGIAAKNGVLIVEFANQLRERGIEFREAVVQAAVVRLRPVLMTSLCTAFGAVPFLFASGAGAEQREPIGVVVFYGTLVSVFLTLFVVPAVYSLVARRTRSSGHTTRLVDRLARQRTRQLGRSSRPDQSAAPARSRPTLRPQSTGFGSAWKACRRLSPSRCGSCGSNRRRHRQCCDASSTRSASRLRQSRSSGGPTERFERMVESIEMSAHLVASAMLDEPRDDAVDDRLAVLGFADLEVRRVDAWPR
jgi:hypothetical protein